MIFLFASVVKKSSFDSQFHVLSSGSSKTNESVLVLMILRNSASEAGFDLEGRQGSRRNHEFCLLSIIVDACPVSFYYKAKVYCLLSFTFTCFLEGNIEQILLKITKRVKREVGMFSITFFGKKPDSSSNSVSLFVTNETLAKFVLLYKAVLRNPA